MGYPKNHPEFFLPCSSGTSAIMVRCTLNWTLAYSPGILTQCLLDDRNGPVGCFRGADMIAAAEPMAKKRKPGRPKVTVKRESIVNLKGVPEYKTWLDE